MPGGPLADTLARLDADHEYCRFVAGRPGEDWILLADLLDDADILGRWFRERDLTAPIASPADVAGSFLAGWLADIVADPVVACYHRERRAWPIDPAVLYVHRDPVGWFDGLAVDSPRVYVLPDDPAALAGEADVEVVADAEVLLARIADELVAVLDRVFAAVRALAPYGTRGMWGAAADSLVGSAVHAAVRHGADTEAAFDAATAVVDAIAAAAPLLKVRPSKLPVTFSGGTAVMSRKGTCCLLYKLVPGADVAGEGYCISCPLREPHSQHARFATWLDEIAPTTG